MHKLVFASTFLIASFQGLLCENLAEHSIFQDDGELSTSPRLRLVKNAVVSESVEKIQKIKGNPPVMQRMGKQRSMRDPNYVNWSSVTNNKDVLREHSKERLFV